MKIEFTHAGVTRTLAKHPQILARLKLGHITEEQANDSAWYLRFKTAGKKRTFKLTVLKEKEAIRQAIDLLKAQVARPNDFAEFIQARDANLSVNIGELSTDWFAAGLPFSRKRHRTLEAAQHLRDTTDRALYWWQDKITANITPDTHDKYVVHRRQNVRKGFDGNRSADVEMAALSCLCQWAVKVGRIKTNPFEGRECSVDPGKIKHCHLSMPGNDDEFHRILTSFFTPTPVPAPSLKPSRTATLTPAQAAARRIAADNQRIIVGAWLAFSALSGLRPGEHKFLQRVPATTAFPSDLRAAPCGLIYPMPDGTRRMKVFRTKRGQNPAIVIHPAMQDFLDHYLPWLSSYYSSLPTPQPSLHQSLFPGLAGEGKLNAYLRRACIAANLPKMKPHGFGRAYYVRVRRSQGHEDMVIAVELGQSSNGELVRSVYGDPIDPVGGNLHNWLPENGTAAWQHLALTTQPNIIAL